MSGKLEQNKRFADLYTEAIYKKHKNARVYYVDSVNGNDAYSGRKFTQPLATTQEAIGRCSASRGDTILIAPWHAENITGASSFVPNKSYVNIIGLKQGNLKPTFTFTAAAGAIDFSAAACLLKDVYFTTLGTIDVTAPITFSGNNCIMQGVEMRESAATSQFVFGALVTGDDCVVDGFKFLGAAGDANVTGLRLTGADRVAVKNCDIVGAFQGSADATGAIQCLTTASLNMRVHNNVLENQDGTSEAGIVFITTCTGLVYENFIAVPTGDFGQGIVGDNLMRQYDNNVVDVAQERGAPEGTASA